LDNNNYYTVITVVFININHKQLINIYDGNIAKVQYGYHLENYLNVYINYIFVGTLKCKNG